jgi:hypothetical protein
LGSVRQTLLWLLEHKLDLPARRDNGNVVWSRPRYSTVYQIIANPAYGGAYAYGNTGAAVRFNGSSAKAGVRRRAREEWLTLRPGAHEGYVDLGTAQRRSVR